jgi:predicted phosphodiesterase
MSKDFHRFIHLSDIHFGQEKNGTRVIHEDARAKLVEDVAEFANTHGPADGILVVGDTAYAGEQKEYETAAAWLRDVARAGGCEEYAVRTVPGNHDVDRTRINVYGRNAHSSIRNAAANQLDAILDEHLAVEESGNPLLPKVAAYREFASRFDCDFPSLMKPCWAKDYWLGHQYRLRLLGMNSVQVCDGEDALGKMVLGNNQYIISDEPDVVPVAIIHHPLPWFMDQAKAKPYLQRAPVLLFGHEHMQGFEKVVNQYDQAQLHVFSGAVNPPEGSQDYPFRYNWLEFRLSGEPAKRTLSLSLWPMVWNFQETKYGLDRQGLGSRPFFTFDVPCPRFTPEVSPVAVSRPVLVTTDPTGSGEVSMVDSDHHFEQLKYFFWTYLDWQERLKALVSLDCLPKATSQPLPQTLEHLALRTARQKGRLEELWNLTMASVPSEKQLPNPYTKGMR